MKITFFEATTEEEKVLGEMLAGIDCRFISEKISQKNMREADGSDAISVFVNSTLSKEVIDSLPGLKLISTRSTGFDHIDIEYAKSKGIKVVNVPSYGSRTVAEFAFALLLNLSRKVNIAAEQIRDQGSFDIEKFRGFDLFGKTIGVIGTGKIGKNAVKIARGFGMNVLAFDKFPDEKFAAENDMKYVGLDELLKNSDVVTIHTLYNKETYHLINQENIKQMKKGSYLINTARGEIVETDALVWALKEGVLAGAGLDVLEGERKLKDGVEAVLGETKKGENFKILLEDHMLMEMPNVIITPHIAFSTVEAENEIMKTTAENILEFSRGNVTNAVN